MASDRHRSRPARDHRLDALASQAKRGDRSALSELCGELEPRVRAYMTQVLSDTHDAEEAAQDVLAKVIESLPRFRSDSGFASWAFAIAHNHAMDFRRARSRSAATDPWDVDRARERAARHGDPDAPRDQHSVLRELISPLPQLQREVLTLLYELDMSAEQVGEVLGRTAASVRQEHRRARERLGAVIERERVRLFGR